MFLTLTLASNDALIRPYSLKFIPLKGIMRKMYSTKNNSNNNVVKANIIRYRANTYSSMSTLVRRNFHTHSRALWVSHTVCIRTLVKRRKKRVSQKYTKQFTRRKIIENQTLCPHHHDSFALYACVRFGKMITTYRQDLSFVAEL